MLNECCDIHTDLRTWKTFVIVPRILTWAGLSASRPSVLIFGASNSGRSQFERIRRSHEVIGFVDNSSSKQGLSLNKKPIYSPQDIPKLRYDEIIVASCYYEEITKQLIDDINVEPEKISIFYPDGEPDTQVWSKITRYIGYQYFRGLLNATHLVVAEIGFRIARYADTTYKQVELRPIHWLDEQLDEVESILQPESQADIYGPKIIGEPQKKSAVLLPAVRLLRYAEATIFCTSNSLFCNKKLFMWRSPTSDNSHSDYSAGYIIKHGQRFALTEAVGVTGISKGIAITGSVDINYYHWMLEVVSKLEYLGGISEEYADYPVLISEKSTGN